VAALLVLAAWAGTPTAWTRDGSASPPILVGAKTFTEQYVLAEILARTVEARTARPARTLTSLGSTVAFDALRRDEIDVYVDYTGTLWATVMGRHGGGASRRDVEEEVRRWLRDEAGVTLVASLGFENAYCFAVRRETAARFGLRTLADLARHARELSLASDYEFFAREEWRAVQGAYGLAFRERRTMDPSLLYAAIAAGSVDAITAYSSDGRIEALGLVVLEDERHAIPPYDAVVLASPRLAREAPDVVEALRGLEGTIDVARMRALNRLVDERGMTPAAAARTFLESLEGQISKQRIDSRSFGTPGKPRTGVPQEHHFFGNPTVWASTTRWLSRSFSALARPGPSKDARTTTARPSDAQKRYTFWQMKAASA
jgi:osmoprotectant transport system permease protein